MMHKVWPEDSAVRALTLYFACFCKRPWETQKLTNMQKHWQLQKRALEGRWRTLVFLKPVLSTLLSGTAKHCVVALSIIIEYKQRGYLGYLQSSRVCEKPGHLNDLEER